jgi:hypothetical protein
MSRTRDGEWLEPDPEDIAAHETAGSVKRLIDTIVSEKTMCPGAARALPMSAGDLNFRSPQSAIFRCASARHSGYRVLRTNQ